MELANRRKIELDLRAFVSKNLERPSDCQNLEQVRYYIKEISEKISELERVHKYAPDWVYGLLAGYNAQQNKMLYAEFKNTYA